MDFLVGVSPHLYWIYHTYSASLIIYNLDYKVGLELIKLYIHQCLVFDSILQLCTLLSLEMWVKDIGEYFVLFFLQIIMNQIFLLKLRKWNWNLKAHVKTFEWLLLNLYMFYSKSFPVLLLPISIIIFWISSLFYCRDLAKHLTECLRKNSILPLTSTR